MQPELPLARLCNKVELHRGDDDLIVVSCRNQLNVCVCQSFANERLSFVVASTIDVVALHKRHRTGAVQTVELPAVGNDRQPAGVKFESGPSVTFVSDVAELGGDISTADTQWIVAVEQVHVGNVEIRKVESAEQHNGVSGRIETKLGKSFCSLGTQNRDRVIVTSTRGIIAVNHSQIARVGLCAADALVHDDGIAVGVELHRGVVAVSFVVGFRDRLAAAAARWVVASQQPQTALTVDVVGVGNHRIAEGIELHRQVAAGGQRCTDDGRVTQFLLTGIRCADRVHRGRRCGRHRCQQNDHNRRNRYATWPFLEYAHIPRMPHADARPTADVNRRSARLRRRSVRTDYSSRQFA